jgi:outer membrane receptor protein involved in Fe transport
LVDKIGTALSGSARFTRFNPSVGATYKVTPNVTGYFNFAQANRSPDAGRNHLFRPDKAVQPRSFSHFRPARSAADRGDDL